MSTHSGEDIKILNVLFYVEDDVPIIVPTVKGLPVSDAKALADRLKDITESFKLDTMLLDEGITPIVSYIWTNRNDNREIANFTVALNTPPLLGMFTLWLQKVSEKGKYLSLVNIVEGDMAITLPVPVVIPDETREFFSKRAKVFNDLLELARKKAEESERGIKGE